MLAEGVATFGFVVLVVVVDGVDEVEEVGPPAPAGAAGAGAAEVGAPTVYWVPVTTVTSAPVVTWLGS